MVIDPNIFFDYDLAYNLKTMLLNMAKNEIKSCSNSCSTKEDRDAYLTLEHYIDAEVAIEGFSIQTIAKINRDNFSPEFLKKYSSLIDLADMNLEKKNRFFVENELYNIFSSSSYKDMITDYLRPQIESAILSKFGGT